MTYILRNTEPTSSVPDETKKKNIKQNGKTLSSWNSELEQLDCIAVRRQREQTNKQGTKKELWTRSRWHNYCNISRESGRFASLLHLQASNSQHTQFIKLALLLAREIKMERQNDLLVRKLNSSRKTFSPTRGMRTNVLELHYSAERGRGFRVSPGAHSSLCIWDGSATCIRIGKETIWIAMCPRVMQDADAGRENE